MKLRSMGLVGPLLFKVLGWRGTGNPAFWSTSTLASWVVWRSCIARVEEGWVERQ